MTTQELRDELKRRETKHNIRVADTVFALNLDEMEAIKEQIDKFFPGPSTPLSEFEKAVEKARKERWDDLPIPSVPYYPPPAPSNPWPTLDPNPPYETYPKIWCSVDMNRQPVKDKPVLARTVYANFSQ